MAAPSDRAIGRVRARRGADVTPCLLCREEINDDATVCRFCGAYAVEARSEIDWYRKGDSPARAGWARWRWLMITLAIATALLLSGLQALSQSNREADRVVDEVCEDSNLPGC